MTSDDLYALFRSDIVDAVAPYLWSDTEVWNYMNDAYRMFVRRTGGILDTTSSLTSVAIVANQPTSRVSPLILRFNSAYLLSDGTELKIINEAEQAGYTRTDYSNELSARNTIPGSVRRMIVGLDNVADYGIVRWQNVPAVNDTAKLSVYRLPLDTVASGFAFDEVREEHHESFLMWMKHRAYGKQDAETFDRGRRDEFKQEFYNYCADAKRERDRYKSHTHVVSYGGL